jgi:hypothetical protein
MLSLFLGITKTSILGCDYSPWALVGPSPAFSPEEGLNTAEEIQSATVGKTANSKMQSKRLARKTTPCSRPNRSLND